MRRPAGWRDDGESGSAELGQDLHPVKILAGQIQAEHPVGVHGRLVCAVELVDDGLDEAGAFDAALKPLPDHGGGLADGGEIAPAVPPALLDADIVHVVIQSVVVLPEWLNGTPWEGLPGRPVDGLGITREDIGGHILYRLG